MENNNCYKDKVELEQLTREVCQQTEEENEYIIGFPMNYTRLIPEAITEGMFKRSMRRNDIIVVSIDDTYYDNMISTNENNMLIFKQCLENKLKYLNNNLNNYTFIRRRDIDGNIQSYNHNTQIMIIDTISINPSYKELHDILTSGTGIKILLIKNSVINNSLDNLYGDKIKNNDNYEEVALPRTYAKFTIFKDELINNLRFITPILILQYKNSNKNALDIADLQIYKSNEIY